jgi:hypothetical protein
MSEKGEKEAGRPRRRRFQFSLGSMLLLMTVFGVWFGIRMDRARRQERAVAALGERGGVSYDSVFVNMSNPKQFMKTAPYGPKWLRAVVSDNFFDRVRGVYLYESTTDADLENLKDLPDVESLIIASSLVTDAGVARLKHASALKELILDCPGVSDAGLLHLRSLQKLRHLELLCSATDAGMIHLLSLQELRFLAIACPITDDGILALEALKRLEGLRISGTVRMASACRLAAAELESPSQIETIEEPLCSVRKYLANFHGIDVPIDKEAAIVNGRKALEIPITVKLDKVPLTTVLDAMLEDTGLDWILTQKGILITTEEKAADRLAAVRELQRRLPSLKKVVCVVEP